MSDPDRPTYLPKMTASSASYDSAAARSAIAGNSTTVGSSTTAPTASNSAAVEHTTHRACPTELPTNTPTNPPNSTAPIFIANYTLNPDRRTFLAIDLSAFPPLTAEDFAPPPTPIEQIAALRCQVAALEARIAETPEQQVKRLLEKTEDKKVTLVEVITELDRRRAVAVEELVEAEKELAALKAWMQARERAV